MCITCRLARFDQKRVFSLLLLLFLFFLCSSSPSSINYACRNFRTTCAMGLMFTLQHEFELSMLPSIPYNCHVGSLCSEEFEDTKGVIGIRKSKKNRQHNGQKDIQRSTKRTHKTKDLLNIHIKLKIY
jgi:hypothetical protein